MRNRLVILSHCTIQSRDGWQTEVCFYDGLTASATPHNTPHYHVIAHRCGYGDNLAAYCFEHEFFHAFCEQWFHDRPSRVLRGLAEGQMLSGHEAAYEELVAQVAQRWVRANERPIIGGVKWDEFKRVALGLLGELK